MRVNEQGRSMIEMLGVLAIIGVLTVGGIAGYSKAMDKFRTNKLTEQVSMIVTNIRTLYAQQTSYDGLNTTTAIEMGVIPDEMVIKNNGTATGSLTNPYNGGAFVKSGNGGAAMAGGSDSDTKAFVVTVTNISRQACVSLATSDWGSGSSSGLIAVKAGSSTTALTDVADDATNMVYNCAGDEKNIACPGGSKLAVPMKVATAATACACGTQNTCYLSWKYY